MMDVAREDCAAAAAAVLRQAGHSRAIYEITGAERFTAEGLASLYAELGRQPVLERGLDDATFIATLVGSATGDDHLRFGAELVASFGRSIREGYMDSCTDAVAKLTGRAPLALRQLLAPLERKG
jgi:NAD(P)H dehydrogenase (quinone)